MDSKKFGEFIATIRKEKGWTQAELAEKISVTDKAVSRWERGVSHSLRYHTKEDEHTHIHYQLQYTVFSAI